MKIAYSRKQLTFKEMKGSLSRLPKNSQWVRLGDSLPWDEFDKLYLSRLRNDGRGAKNLPSRMIIGARIIRHKWRLSDIDTIQAIRENPYMQFVPFVPFVWRMTRAGVLIICAICAICARQWALGRRG